jgi:glutathione peroxidase-family protein
MKKILLLSLVFIAIAACSSEKKPTAFIQAKITVADSLDASGNFGGIGFLIIQRDSTQKADTVFYAVTDSLGEFNAKIQFPAKGLYPVYVSRNGKTLASSSIVLAENDTLILSAELPAYNQTVKISSYEYDAQDTFGRVRRNFSRVALYVNSGKLSNDTLPEVLGNWSALFWSVHEKYPGTIAADQAMVESMKLLAEWNDSLLIKRYESIDPQSNMRIALGRAAGEAKARSEGLSSAIVYLDGIRQKAPTQAQALQIIRNQVELLADSNKHEEAYFKIQEHKRLFDTVKGAASWATYFSRETKRLAPGNPLPEFLLAAKKDSLSKKSFEGSYFVLEIAGLADQNYQAQIGDINAVYQLYKNYGLKWLTVPLDPQVTIDAFLEERKPEWLFTMAHDFQKYPLMDSLNVIEVPTRFLVDKNGIIVRKYNPTQFDRLINDYLKEIQKGDEPNS